MGGHQEALDFCSLIERCVAHATQLTLLKYMQLPCYQSVPRAELMFIYVNALCFMPIRNSPS